MSKVIGNMAILVAGSLVMLSGMLAVGILFLAAAVIVMGRRVSAGLTRIVTGAGS
jgi:hypothetical protein